MNGCTTAIHWAAARSTRYQAVTARALPGSRPELLQARGSCRTGRSSAQAEACAHSPPRSLAHCGKRDVCWSKLCGVNWSATCRSGCFFPAALIRAPSPPLHHDTTRGGWRRIRPDSISHDGGGELPKAKRVAAHYGTEHHELHIAGGAVADLVEKMVYHHDMPFSDAANIPLYLMASQISGHTKVVLQGDGGDELFGGYRRYSTLNHYRLLHAMARRSAAPAPLRAQDTPLRHRVRRYLHAFAAEDLATMMALLLTPEDRSSSPPRYSRPGCGRLWSNVTRSPATANASGCSANTTSGNQMSFVDLLTTLPDTYLEKVDRSTMAASLEVRVPFLDHDLVDFVVRLPVRSKMPWGRKKWLLKSALAWHRARRGSTWPKDRSRGAGRRVAAERAETLVLRSPVELRASKSAVYWTLITYGLFAQTVARSAQPFTHAVEGAELHGLGEHVEGRFSKKVVAK